MVQRVFDEKRDGKKECQASHPGKEPGSHEHFPMKMPQREASRLARWGPSGFWERRRGG